MQEKPQGVRDGSGGKGPGRPVAVDLMDEEPRQPRKHGMIPVWFFVGVILLIYGLIIFITGLYELSHAPPTVLANLHPAIWWGAVLVVIGGVYVWVFLPRRG